MASTTAESHTAADSTKEVVEVSSSSSAEQSKNEGGAGGEALTESSHQSFASENNEALAQQPPQIKNNQQIRTGRNRSNQSDDEEDDLDEDSNDCGGPGPLDAASSTTGSNNNGFHDESSGGSTSSGSRIPAYSSNNVFNAPICSPSSPFQSSSSKSNPFSTSSASSFQQRPILRPSAFKFASATPTQPSATLGSSSAASSSPFVLRPPKLIPSTSSSAPTTTKQPAQDEPQQTPTFVPLEKESSTSETQSHPQAPAAAQESSEKVPEPAEQERSASSSFVFGSNLSERVVEGASSTSSSGGVKRKIGDEEENKDVKKPSVAEEGETQPSLPQQVLTGEEDEINVLQIQCRLFIFDGAHSTWIERGRGLLRLNDSKDNSKPTSSRLIIRSKGAMRVLLNTRVWEGMRVEKASDKSIRLMAVDLEGEDASAANNAGDGGNASALRVFLIMTTSMSDTVTLTSALESRVRRLTNEEERK